jgi:streptomycin 6-kinase
MTGAGPGEADPDATIRLQPLTRAKVGSLGPAGQDWLSRLPATLRELEREWQIRLGRPLPGGSAAYVVAATRADGVPAVVKVVIEPDGLDAQAAILRRAGGRGYVRLLGYDPDRRALLMEALGPPLDHTAPAPANWLDLLADTLLAAWRAPEPADTRPDKAGDLAGLITTWWDRLGRPCSPAVYRQALAFAERRRAEPGEPVVVHGDPHPGNLLRVLRPRPGAETGYCFVDPDGFVTDRAYDLGVVLRDWTSQLRGADAEPTLRTYCSRLADRTGVDAVRIWEWGFVERVSTGLYLKSFGADGLAGRFLASAEALLP